MNSIITSAIHSTDKINKSSHYHDCHQILFIKSGLIELSLNGEKHRVGDNSIVIISRYEEHSVKQLSSEYDRYSMRINPKLDQISEENNNYIKSVLINRPDFFSNIFDMTEYKEELSNIFNQICKEFKEKLPLSDEFINLLFRQIMLLILRKDPRLIQFVKKDDYLITEKIREKFERYYGESYSLESLAKEYNISKSYLSHIFKKHTGISIMNYLLSCRIVAAKNKLTKTDLSVGEIVEACGFSDFSNFSRSFKKSVGMTPREFKNQYKK